MISFERTTCACQKCVECCKRKPGPLILSDLERLREAGINAGDTLVQSEGGIYGAVINGRLRFIRVPTITPRRVNGRCIFLAADRCLIHDIAPFGCAYFDTHMPTTEWRRRSIAMASDQARPEYQRARELLRKEGA
jgi:Fe-S-cluster containining protein